MQQGQPSQTALGAAYHRAVHQVLEGGRIFTDPLAVRILGRMPKRLSAMPKMIHPNEDCACSLR